MEDAYHVMVSAFHQVVSVFHQVVSVFHQVVSVFHQVVSVFHQMVSVLYQMVVSSIAGYACIPVDGNHLLLSSQTHPSTDSGRTLKPSICFALRNVPDILERNDFKNSPKPLFSKGKAGCYLATLFRTHS